MSFVREALVGVLTAVAVSLLVVGAITLAMTEGMVPQDDIQETDVLPLTTPGQSFPGAVYTTQTLRPTKGLRLVTATVQPTHVSCSDAIPGWVVYDVHTGDSWDSLAASHSVSKDQILKANCIGPSSDIYMFKKLLLPPLPPTEIPVTNTPVSSLTSSTTPRLVTPCGAPRGWKIYVVEAGDNLTRIAIKFSTTVYAIEQANCLNNDQIVTGDRLYVPNVPPRYTPTRTPVPTSTRPPANTFTYTPRATNTFTPSHIPPTSTYTPVVSKTPTLTPSATPLPPTSTFTYTPVGTKTPTVASIPSATPTFTPKP
jgi:LysM repeat protein